MLFYSLTHIEFLIQAPIIDATLFFQFILYHLFCLQCSKINTFMFFGFLLVASVGILPSSGGFTDKIIVLIDHFTPEFLDFCSAAKYNL